MGLFDFFKKKKPKVNITFSSHEYTPQELQQQQEDKVAKIKNLVRNSIPSENGLRPHEIAILSHATHYKTLGNDFPRYWYFDYGIDDPQQVLNMLLDRGFIRAATAKESAEKLKVAELKDILSEFGFAAKGKKADLVAAVRENIEEEDLARKIPVRRYALTDLGEQELKENEYVTYFDGSDRYGLTVWDMNKLLEGYPHKLFRDKIWYTLNKNLYELEGKFLTDGDIFDFYRQESYIHYAMCRFLNEENRHPENAIMLWSQAFYYDIKVGAVRSFRSQLDSEKFNASQHAKVHSQEPNENRPSNGFKDVLNFEYRLRDLKVTTEKLEISCLDMHKTLVSEFKKCSVEYDMIKGWNITKLTLSDEELADLVIAEMVGDSEKANAIYEKIEQEIRSDKTPLFKSVLTQEQRKRAKIKVTIR